MIYLPFSGAESNQSPAFFYFDSERFEHFYYFYKHFCDKDSFENDQKTKKQTNVMSVNVIVKIGVVGDFTNDDLKLFPEGNVTFLKVLKIFDKFLVEWCNKNNQCNLSINIGNMLTSATEPIWEAAPLLCFQNNLSLTSALEVSNYPHV